MRRLLAAAFFIAAAGLWSGCPAPTPVPDGPPAIKLDAATSPVCSMDGGLPMTADVCVNMVRDHRPCAKCPAGQDQCLDATDMVWCVRACSECTPDVGGDGSARAKRPAVLR